MNGEVTLTVDEIIESSSPVSIPEGKVILSLADTADTWRQEGIDSLEAGDTVTIKTESSPEWNDVSYAVGSLYKADYGGQGRSGPGGKQGAPDRCRSKERRTVVFYTWRRQAVGILGWDNDDAACKPPHRARMRRGLHNGRRRLDEPERDVHRGQLDIADQLPVRRISALGY